MPRLTGRLALLAVLLSAVPCAAADDPLPDGAVARIGTLRLRHVGGVVNVAFAPDGKSLASCGNDGLVRLWDVTTGQEIRRFEGNKGTPEGLAFSPDGKTILSAGTDKLARLWDVATGKQRLAFLGHTGSVNAVAFSPDGKTVATKGHDASARLWDAATGKELHKFDVAEDPGTSNVAFTPDGKGLAVVGRGNDLVIFDTATGKETRRFAGRESFVTSLHFSPDGKVLASAGSEGLGKLWDVATGKEFRQLRGHDDTVAAVRFGPDGKTVATCGVDQTVRLWDAATGKERWRMMGHTAVISEIAYSPDGKVLASAGWDQTIRLWDAATGKELPQSAGPGPIACAALSSDGKLLVTAHKGDALHLWDPATGKPLARDRLAFAGPVVTVALSADGRLIAAANVAGDFAVWEAATGKKRFTVEAGKFASAPTSVLVFTPDGKALAVVHDGGGTGIDLLDAATGKRLRSIPVLVKGQDGTSSKTPFPPTKVAFAPDGQTFFSASITDGVSVHESATGKELRRLNSGREHTFSDVAFSPDGRTIATSRLWGAVRLWETATGAQRCLIGPKLESWSSVAAAPDGRLLAAGGAESHAVRVWQLPTGQELGTFRGHGGPVTALAFCAGGKLMSVNADGTALIWDTSKLKREPKEKPGKIDAEAAWAGLADGDGTKAFEWIVRLSESPGAAVALLRERLKLGADPDARRIEQLMAQLDDDEFDRRELAMRELEKLGTRVEGALRKAVKSSASAEVVRRAGDLLKKIEDRATSGERLRESRALEVLEGLGTPEARKLLEELAAGAPDAALTREARASLGRLTGRP
jgi:WD40 repeat protein